MNKPLNTHASNTQQRRLVLPSPAKLNLFLHITGRRDDGYHQLQTLFQLLDYGDTITLDTRTDNRIALSDSLAGVPDSDNIVIRAAQLLQRQIINNRTDKSSALSTCPLGATIGITKRIPMGGGLGGGSSNAASTLLGLNYLWQAGLSIAQLAKLGLSLGADVPVFIHGLSSFAEGVGDELQALALPKRWYIVIKPPVSVPTATIFSHAQLTRDTLPIRIAAVFEPPDPLHEAGQYSAEIEPILHSSLRNDCEAVVRAEYPAIDEALQWLGHQTGQIGVARLTGTGACIFASFATQVAAQTVLDCMPAGLSGFIALGVNRSTAHKALEEQDLYN